MTDITREAVEARAALLRSDYAADGAAFDADMLLALLDRAEKGEKLAQFYKDAFRRVKEEAKRRVERLNCRLDDVWLSWKAKADTLTAERDRLTAELAEIGAALGIDEASTGPRDAVKNTLRLLAEADQRVSALTADLTTARETIKGMRSVLGSSRKAITRAMPISNDKTALVDKINAAICKTKKAPDHG